MMILESNVAQQQHTDPVGVGGVFRELVLESTTRSQYELLLLRFIVQLYL